MTPFLQEAGLVGQPPGAGEAELIAAAAPLIQERIATLAQAPGMLAFLFTGSGGFAGSGGSGDFTVDPDDAAKLLTPESAVVLQAAEAALKGVDDWQSAAIDEALRGALLEGGLGLKPRAAFGPVRVAVTGRRVSPPLFESIELLGRERTMARLARAIDSLAT